MFHPGADQWRVQHENRLYRPGAESDVDLLLSLLPLEVADSDTRWETDSDQPAVAAIAADAGWTLEFRRRHDRPLTRLPITPRPRRPVVSWSTPVDEDGWIPVDSTLQVDGARVITIDAYLPESDAGPKELAVVATVGRRTTIDVAVLGRGTTTRVELFNSDRPVDQIALELHASYPEPVGHEGRALGFVLVEALAR
ncbi:MAG: hypothetical protein HKN26_12555 [Acidimicrobiales bacterium]|nr:hypothetical protein [Acidimicrobiales bacterium]